MKAKSFFFSVLLMMLLPLAAAAQYGVLSPLHTDGQQLKDANGNRVVLHGVMDTPNPYFNGNRWGSSASVAYVGKCIDYFDKLYTAITKPDSGTYCNVFRLHLDPCWCFVNGTSESDYAAFSLSRFKQFWEKLYWPLIQKAMGHGLYVVVRPPGVCPSTIAVNDGYNEYLKTVWNYVANDDSIKKYSGYISLELANEPVTINAATGGSAASAPHDFFQPICDSIRHQGFNGIIWVPGSGYQSIYTTYTDHPITGYNIGYAVHNYPGWYGATDSLCDSTTYIAKFEEMVPVVKTNPVLISEVDWSPEIAGKGKYNEFGVWVPANHGTWGTASTSKWGTAYKALIDKYGISMTLTSTSDYISIDDYINKGNVVAAFADVPEACGVTCWNWYKTYAQKNVAYPSFTRTYSADQGNGTYINPILNADFPDPDVIRVGDTFYMSTTTMYHFPGVTIMKSKDLVNWEYCCNPLQSIKDDDYYNLQNGKNRYAQGAWASTLKYYNGRFYLGFLAFGDDGGYFLLDTDNPEGTWNARKLTDAYYDSGLLFDNDGRKYIVSGINTITVTELDDNFAKKSSVEVINKANSGLEGNHMYHIGDYYYIYSTYGGTEGSQTIFRSTSPMGTYTECSARLMSGQNIHQGALVDTPTGEWWTILFKDAGPIGRVPYLEPVTWTDGWPLLGNAGIDVSKNATAYKKPNVGQTYPTTVLPTNDTFTSLSLGMQWQWNHQPDSKAWSLTEKPGMLRLYTSGTSDNLKQARNSLTQRMVALAPEGTLNSKKPLVYGTIKIATQHMTDGDVTGLAVFQDPYSYVAVKNIGGTRHLYVYRDAYDTNTASETDCGEISADTVYLQARANFGTNMVTFYYSTDNQTYTRAGSLSFPMRYLVTVFVGQRFYIFNYATKQNGGYVDVDWFTTETNFTENTYYSPEALQTYSAEDLQLDHLETITNMTALNGGTYDLPIYAVMKSGLRSNVASNCTFTIDKETIATISRGTLTGHAEGTANVVGTYTDYSGTAHSFTFPVTVETFPLTSDFFNPSITGTGTFDATTLQFTTAAKGFAGWEYSAGLDLSSYQYIVIQLSEKPAVSTTFYIYDASNSYSRTITAATTKIRLSNASNVNLKAVTKIGFQTSGGSAIKPIQLFLSNDGVTPTGIADVITAGQVVNTTYYGIDGTLRQAPAKGVNIIRYTLSDGTVKTRKVTIP
jgi:beta-xylosidase